MKKSFLLIAVCIFGYMALTSHLVTKISAHQISKNENSEGNLMTPEKQSKEQFFQLAENTKAKTIDFKFLKPNAFKNLEVSDLKGKKLLALQDCKGTVHFDTKMFSEGTYYVSLTTVEGEKISKSFQIH